jgi:ubiquinone biosynthesis protein UbiJ
MEAAAAHQTANLFSATRTAAAFLNHLLRGNPWALERLRQFSGKSVHFDTTPFRFTLTIGGNGEVMPATPDSIADANVVATLPLLMRIVAMREPDMSLVELAGDPALLEEITYLVQHLVWDVEEDLSHVFGDPVAHRLADSGKKLMRWPSTALFGFAGALSEYWTEERPLLARSEEVRRFLREVSLLALEVETLEKRIAKLERV